jgi:excinuclease ABC subunit C
MVALSLKKKVSRFPELPGVYLMKDESGTVLYVGKARDLRARVRNYLGAGDGRFQISLLMEKVSAIDTMVCENERQAFLLERDLIGKFKPKFNIKLKDDKSYLSVRIDKTHEWPRLDLVRRPTNDNADYFGPFAFSYELKQVLEVIKKVIPLRTCSDAVLYNRQRPCLEYQIKRCAGPCCLPVDNRLYREWVDEAIGILHGKTEKVVKRLTERMEEASEELRFEEAAAMRDRLTVLTRFSEGHRMVFHRSTSRDAFGVYREGAHAVVTLVKMRNGRISATRNFPLSPAVVPDEELLMMVLEELYLSGDEVPREVLLPSDLGDMSVLSGFIGELGIKAPEFLVPQRGANIRLIKLAELNARQYFATHFDAELRYRSVVSRLEELLGENDVEYRRIECVDISNFQGQDKVGALVVFFDGVPLKKEYRRYKVADDGHQDDFASIYEVVFRRLRRGKETGELPDLLVIDGGKGQLSKACEARDDLGLDTRIIGLAKMRTERNMAATEVERSSERVFLEGAEDGIPLTLHDELTHLLQKIRDEVHEYVISYHRLVRGRRLTTSSLDVIPGVGPERKRRLLKAFGSIKGIAAASPEAIAKAGRMPLPVGEKILRFFQDSEDPS